MRAGMYGERGRYLSNKAPTRLASLTRVISGLQVRMPERDFQQLSDMARADVSQRADASAFPVRTPRDFGGTK